MERQFISKNSQSPKVVFRCLRTLWRTITPPKGPQVGNRQLICLKRQVITLQISQLIALWALALSVCTPQEADVLQRVVLITHPQQTNRWFHLHLAGKMNYQASPPASRREEYFFCHFSKWAYLEWFWMDEQPRADVSPEATGIQLSQTFCFRYTRAHFFSGVTWAGRPSSKYATAAVSLHVLGVFLCWKQEKRCPLLVNSWQ